jgi:hypothetical protein
MNAYPDENGWYIVKEKGSGKPHKRYFNKGIGKNGKFVNTPNGDELWWVDNICIPHNNVEWWKDIQ